MAPLWGSSIREFKVEPMKSVYYPAEEVKVSGKLIIHKFWWEDAAPPGRTIRFYTDMVKSPIETITGSEGMFVAVVPLPAEPGTYFLRANFPGYDMSAYEDGTWSNPVEVDVAVPPPLVPPTLPPIIYPIPIGTIILWASAGLIGLSLLAMVARRWRSS